MKGSTKKDEKKLHKKNMENAKVFSKLEATCQHYNKIMLLASLFIVIYLFSEFFLYF
jgi:hypothetical protein